MVVLPTSTLEARDAYCRSGYRYVNGRCRRDSAWYWWGRWVLAGIVLFGLLFLIVIVACVNSRRRRKRGLQPVYGTGWMAPPPKYDQQQQWQQQQQPQGQYPQQTYPQYGAPPAYGQPVQNQYTGTTFNPNDGYYGAQNEGIQLQQPQQSYQQPHSGVYSPPPGPPPGK